ncbi:Copper-exporting P-type ATPase A [bacterium HR15]|nr:Copper-exporting P-type ATPase A [bacterium HR15]
MPRQRLRIKGMTCASCVRRVEKALQRVPGVQQAIVNLATEQAEVELVEPVPPDTLIEAVRTVGYEAEPAIESRAVQEDLRAVRLRLIISLVFSLPVLILSMLLPGVLPGQGWWLLTLTTPVQFGVAFPFYRAAWGALRSGSSNMEVLILTGTLAAYFYSFALTLSGQHHHLYYETSAVIITLVLLGKYLEARAKGRARAAMEAIWSLVPQQVLRWNGIEYQPAPIETVQPGDRLLVRTGERVPVDGEVLEGRGWLDESALTGESVPRECLPGDSVLGGALLTDGMLHIRAVAVGEQTALAQIARAVEAAQSQKGAIQRLADRIAAIFVPVVIVVALLTFIGWWLTTRSLAEAIIPAVSVLVIACPCALGLAVPIALMTGTTRAARMGILLRGIEALERVRQIDTLVLDKTGTLTMGQPRLTRIRLAVPEGEAPAEPNENEILQLAAALERAVRHPLADAIVREAERRGLDLEQMAKSKWRNGDITVVPGGGVKAAHALIGSPRFLQEQGVEVGKEWSEPVLLALDGRVIAGFDFEDEPLSEAQETIRALQASGLHLILCSGDRPEAVAAFAQRVGISEWYGAQRPHEKAALIAHLQAQGRRVAFVGDGINDAPALAQADLSIAVSTATALASEVADMVLLNRDLRTLLAALQLSKAIYRVIRQNLFFAFVYNMLGIPLAAAGKLNPLIAALAMSLSSVSVVSNALRLLRR